ncbi:MAG: L-fucose/L-arabinose isomerase family protein, partial [Blautia coccoides]
MKKIKLGFAPTRRSIFSAPDAVKYADLTRERLRELDVDFADIKDINEEGLLYREADRIKIAEKFKAEKVDGLFFPHGNFGTEYEVARLAKELNVPVLLWGPRDERPDENGVRLRDSQCGLFATGKVLRRFGVPFTYMTNCRLEDPEFERGIRDFLAVCNVVKVFRGIRILQIGPRPFDFWSTMCNEGELLERFHIQLSPIPIPELTSEMKRVKEEGTEVAKIMTYCHDNMCIKIKENELENVAALKAAMKNLAEKYGCSAIAIQCWNALQGEIGIMPCAANSLLNEEGIPVVCETDIHGAITALLAEAAGMDEARTFFADWTVRHPDNENGELLQHCGPWPVSVAKEKPTIGYPLAFDHPGAVEAEAKHGDMT